MSSWPSMKAGKLRRVLRKLGYSKVPNRGHGSHEVLRAEGRPQLTFAFHNKDTIPGSLVRSILTRQAGLSIDEAKEVLGLD